MDSTDKKVNGDQADDRLSIMEGDSQYQAGRGMFNDVEDLKPTIPAQSPLDPFMGDEGAEVQYRRMKWW